MFNVSHTLEEKIYIGNIPVLRFYPTWIEDKELKTIIFYHGWSSNKDSQRMRAYIMATFGYQVLVPESINHGERGKIENYFDPIEVISKFWPTVISSINEVNIIIDYIVKELKVREEYIGVAGNSMGGMIAAGILGNNDKINTGVILNGSCNWKETNRLLLKVFRLDGVSEISIIEDMISGLDPINKIDKLKDKNILIQHGKDDSLVDIRPQREFIKMVDGISDNIEFIEYDNLNHLVLTNMMEEMIVWFDEYL